MADPGSKFNPKNPDAWGVGNVQYLLAPALGVVLLVGEYDLKHFCLFHRYFQLSRRTSIVIGGEILPLSLDLVGLPRPRPKTERFEKYI